MVHALYVATHDRLDGNFDLSSDSPASHTLTRIIYRQTPKSFTPILSSAQANHTLISESLRAGTEPLKDREHSFYVLQGGPISC